VSTNVPALQWLPTGLSVPSQAAILAGVISDLQSAFGGNLNFTNLNTPQGQLASSLTAIIANANAAFAYLVTQIDPDVAQSFMQDAIARIYFLNRNPGVATAVQCQCIGVSGTVIPAGAQAVDTSGNVYSCTETGTIPSGGSVTLEFQNVLTGPMACPANTLNQIYQAIPGWDAINNSSAGVIGANVETQAAFALRRAATVAANSQGAGPSVYGAVFQVPNVIDVYYTENDTNVAVSVGSTNYSLLPNSLYVAVVGGNAAAIAQAIYLKKSPGCNYNGNTTVQVTDTSGYQTPVPTYNITFNIPTPTAILFAVQIKFSPLVPMNIATIVQQAIIAQFTGANGAPRARIASLILAADYYEPVLAVIEPSLSLLSIQVGFTTANLNYVQMGIDQAPTIFAGNISVALV
jgi:hypothetical protein